jgi:hypothetical protein
MIYDAKFTHIRDYVKPLEVIRSRKRENPNLTLIDVGASANPWTKEFVTHIVDFAYGNLNVKYFTGNICDINVWEEVQDYVKQNGKFDFLVSTHTLEDISSPKMVSNMFGRIAKEGFIAVPSKYIELNKPEGNWLGYIHHRWIYDLRDDQFIGYPKQPFLEHMPFVQEWASKNPYQGRDEIQFFWKDVVDIKIINDDYLGPTTAAVVDYYRNLTQ